MLCTAQSLRPARPLHAAEAGGSGHASESSLRLYGCGWSDGCQLPLVCHHLVHQPMLVRGGVVDQVIEEHAARQRAAQAKGAQ